MSEEVVKKKHFFAEKEYTKNAKARGIYIKYRRAKKVIADIHRNIVVKVILESPEEGFLMPYRIGQIKIKKNQRLSGILAKPVKDADGQYTGVQKLHNNHTFGIVYEYFWNKENFSDIKLAYENPHNYPNYNGLPIIYLKSYNFHTCSSAKKFLKYLIDNQSFVHK